MFSDFWGKNFGFLAKKILLGCQNCFQVSRGYFWKSLFLRTNSSNCFSSFGLRAQIFWIFSEIFAIGMCKLHSMCPVEIFDWTVFLRKFMSFLTVFEPWGSYSAILAQTLQKVYKKCNLCVQKIQGQLRTSGRFVKTALFVSEWDFWLNCFFYEFFEFRHCFPTVNGTFFNIDPKTLGKLSKAHSTWTTIFLRKVCFLKKIFTFTNFSSFDEKLCKQLKKFRPGLKTAFYTRSGDLLA